MTQNTEEVCRESRKASIKKGFLYISFVVNNKIGCKKINLAVRTKILILAGT